MKIWAAVGFLFGRGSIVLGLIPFALPFVATKRESKYVALATIVGGFTLSVETGGKIFLQVLLFFLLSQWIRDRIEWNVFLSVFVSHLLVTYMIAKGIDSYGILFGMIAGGLGLVITLLFRHLPMEKKGKWTSEELICMLLVLGGGIIGVGQAHIQLVLAGYILLVATYALGTAIGATAGVVVGFMMTLSSVAMGNSSFPLAGLLGGLLREGGKWSVALGFMIGANLFSMAGEGLLLTAISAGAFLFTPKKLLSKYKVSTEEKKYHVKLRDVTVDRLMRFGQVFTTIGASFSGSSDLGRTLVAKQFQARAKVMEDFAEDIGTEQESYLQQEEEIYGRLLDFGIPAYYVQIYSLDPGNIDIEVAIPFCQGNGESEKLIAPLLSHLLEENIVVKEEIHGETCLATFGSAQKYTLEMGVASMAKGGKLLCGDSQIGMEVGKGAYAIALSDGMGSGEEAHRMSTETLKLLKKMLQAGINVSVAIQSVNATLTMGQTEERYATLDLAMIDLHTGVVQFLKIGASPSFLKRGDQLYKIEGDNLPIGIVPDLEIDQLELQGKPGDLLVLMTDGVYEGLSEYGDDFQGMHPQDMANLLVEEGKGEDDRTVVVCKMIENIPTWSTISL